MDTNYIIETKNLTKQYGSQKSVADLNIHVKRGRIYGLLGRNGAGKTTTMKMLLGLTKPTSGEVKIWGKPLQGNEKKLLPRIGSLIESPGFYPNLTGTENLRIFATLRGVPNNHAIKDALDLVGLPYKDKKLFSQYSLGMKQRLAIALAVMHDPELLILDEPINGLDPIGIAEVRSFRISRRSLRQVFGRCCYGCFVYDGQRSCTGSSRPAGIGRNQAALGVIYQPAARLRVSLQRPAERKNVIYQTRCQEPYNASGTFFVDFL